MANFFACKYISNIGKISKYLYNDTIILTTLKINYLGITCIIFVINHRYTLYYNGLKICKFFAQNNA